MSYLLTFVASSAAYRAHAIGCRASTTTGKQVAIDNVFESISAARSYADADESGKAGKSTTADFKACKCCK